jgi:hypothetical protein
MAGTILTGVPLAASVVLLVGSLMATDGVGLDFFMPGGLFALQVAGGALLLIAGFIAGRLGAAIGLVTATTVVLFGIISWVADSTGLAPQFASPDGWQSIVAAGSSALYFAAVVGLFVLGVQLCRTRAAAAGSATLA